MYTSNERTDHDLPQFCFWYVCQLYLLHRNRFASCPIEGSVDLPEGALAEGVTELLSVYVTLVIQ
jgi:hypothetical protein